MENITPNTSVVGKEAASPANLVATTHKQEQVLTKYRQMNASLMAFKKKTEDAIAVELHALEKERMKTAEILAELGRKNGQNIENYTSEQTKLITELKDKPLFNPSTMASISESLVTLRAQNAQLRTQFTITFADFMSNFKSVRASVSQVCHSSIQSKITESAEDVKLRLAKLQTLIEDRCTKLSSAVSGVSATPHTQLSFSEPVCTEPEVHPIPAPREVNRYVRPSPFLTRWFAQNTHLL